MAHPMSRQRRRAIFGPEIGAAVTPPARIAEDPSRNAPRPAVPAPPAQPFHHLDTLWLQVAGSLCNLTCTHCFVSCGPQATTHALMTRDQVAARVAEALALGVREIYLTGGEPFLHPDIEAIVADTLAHAPVTVLTNGTLFTAARITWLADRSLASRHALELRISLDGLDAATHDAFRGPGAWLRTLAGLRALVAAGLLPIVTLTAPRGADPLAFTARTAEVLRAEGIAAPRIKLLPLFALGRERERSGPGPASGALAALPAGAFDPHRLQCGTCRAVTSRGVYVCPLLVDDESARMSDTLAGSARAFPLSHGACATCWATGMTCANG